MDNREESELPTYHDKLSFHSKLEAHWWGGEWDICLNTSHDVLALWIIEDSIVEG